MSNRRNPNKNSQNSHYSKKIKIKQNFLNEKRNESINEASDIPGFYFDPVKNRYFKIQSNFFGLQSAITNDSIKIKKETEQNVTKRHLDLKESQNIIHTLDDLKFGTMPKMKYQDNFINYSKLKHCLTIAENQFFSKVSILFENNLEHLNGFKFFLFNFVHSFPYTPAIFKLDLQKSLFTRIDTENLSMENYTLSVGPNSFGIINTILPSYIQNNSFLVSHYEISDRLPYKIKISQLKYEEDFLTSSHIEETDICMRSFNFPMWCSVLSSSRTMKCAVGMPSGAEVNSMVDNTKYKLNTNSSDTYGIRFKDDCEDLIFCACKNKNVYGYDTRVSSIAGKSNSIIQLENKSCAKDLLFNNHDTNYLFSSDFSGEINLWDLRSRKCVNKYFDNIDSNMKCSIRLSKDGSHLYNVSKDGTIRIYNTHSSKLIKKILSPVPKKIHDIYAEIPNIEFIDENKLVYAIENKLLINEI